MKKSLLLLVATSIALSACNNTKTTTEPTTTQAVTANQQAQKASGVWIDVRGADEYNAGHLSDAHNIVPNELVGKIANIEPNKNAPINLYCKSGRRAEVARQILLDLGYTNVTNHGGYQELYDKGLR